MTVENSHWQVYTVTPTSKHGRPPVKAFPCHSLDYFMPPIWLRNVRYFRKPENTSSQTVIQALTNGLAEALELNPVIGATIRAVEKGELIIDPPDNPFVRFHVEFKDHPFEKEDGDDLAPLSRYVSQPPAPVFATKVTSFTCGIVVVASSFHHFVADLQSYFDFLELWAKLVRDGNYDEVKLPKSFEHAPEHFFDNIKASAPPSEIPRGFRILSSPPTGPPPMPKSGLTIWQFPAEILEQLKRDCSPAKETGEWISTGDVMSAIVFGSLTRAREAGKIPRDPILGRSPEESGTEAMAMTADGRERSPGKIMTNGAYFGNFQVINGVTVSRTTLTSTELSDVAAIALSIRRNLHEQVNQEAIKAKLGFFNNPEYTKPIGRIFLHGDVTLTNCCKFNLTGPEFSFGEQLLGGRPFNTTNGGGTLPPGLGILAKDYDSGAVTMILSVEVEAQEFMKKDAVLNKYAKLLLDLEDTGAPAVTHEHVMLRSRL